MKHLGDFAAGATVRTTWQTAAQSGASITRATNGSIRIYRDNGTTERTSASGITDGEDFDGLTGVHALTIDLSDNADAGFYAAGHDYAVVLAGAVIDGLTVNAPLAEFSIENRYHPAAPTVAAIRADLDANSTKLANLDAAVSTRAVQTSVDDLEGRLTAPRAALLDNLDAAVSSRLATAGYTAPPTAAAVRAEIDANSTRLDAAVSSRLASASYTPPDNTGIGVAAVAAAAAATDADLIEARLTAGRATKLDNLDAAISTRLAGSGYTAAPTADQNADALLDRTAGVETSWTLRQALRVILAVLSGKVAISGATVTIRNPGDSKNRVVATTDADGQRTAVTTDVT